MAQGHISVKQGQGHLAEKPASSLHRRRRREEAAAGRLAEEGSPGTARGAAGLGGERGRASPGNWLWDLFVRGSQDPGSGTPKKHGWRPKFHLTGPAPSSPEFMVTPLASATPPPAAIEPDFLLHQPRILPVASCPLPGPATTRSAVYTWPPTLPRAHGLHHSVGLALNCLPTGKRPPPLPRAPLRHQPPQVSRWPPHPEHGHQAQRGRQ